MQLLQYFGINTEWGLLVLHVHSVDPQEKTKILKHTLYRYIMCSLNVIILLTELFISLPQCMDIVYIQKKWTWIWELKNHHLQQCVDVTGTSAILPINFVSFRHQVFRDERSCGDAAFSDASCQVRLRWQCWKKKGIRRTGYCQPSNFRVNCVCKEIPVIN